MPPVASDGTHLTLTCGDAYSLALTRNSLGLAFSSAACPPNMASQEP